MIDELVAGCLENFGHWIVGGMFLVLGLALAVTVPFAEHPVLRLLFALLSLHTAALLIVGFGFKQATRLLAISWIVALVSVLVFAAFSASG